MIMKTKNLILLVVALCCATVTRAQNEVMAATLQKSTGEVTMYYGVNAFLEAYNAAEESGSVITLTAGEFNCGGTCNINKSIQIYGVGWEKGAANGYTQLGGAPSSWGHLKIQGTSETPLENVRIEGVKLWSYATNIYLNNVKNVVVSKCYFASVVVDGASENVTVRQCYIDGGVGGSAQMDGLLVQNCYISSGNYYDNLKGNIQIDHCILSYNNKSAHSPVPLYTNNIIAERGGLAGGATSKHNIFLNIASLNNVPNSEGDWFMNDIINNLFSDVNSKSITYSADRTFELTDEAKGIFIGTDGKPVGINGAGFTWNKNPSTPIINSLNLSVSGTMLNVTWDAETREDNGNTNE